VGCINETCTFQHDERGVAGIAPKLSADNLSHRAYLADEMRQVNNLRKGKTALVFEASLERLAYLQALWVILRVAWACCRAVRYLETLRVKGAFQSWLLSAQRRLTADASIRLVACAIWRSGEGQVRPTRQDHLVRWVEVRNAGKWQCTR
jgi:hypothetical protein